MTRYVLNSGGLRNQPEKAVKFYRELIKGVGDNPRFLLCYFAQPREGWERKMPDHVKSITEAIPEMPLKFELAFSDKFVEQIKSNDIVMLYGGDDTLLQYWLRQYDLPEIWKDKVVGGSSAGSDALCQNFWTCDWRKCSDGLGILPIRFIPHFNSEYGKADPRGPIDWKKAHDELSEYGDRSLPIYALEEGDFIVIEQ
jgi:peptidase E